jgi:putative peptidoglycan lipid II flippase
MKLLGTQSFTAGIFSSTILNVLAKGLQFITTVLIAYFFGANGDTDLYYFIISISLLITTLINNLDNVAFIPEFIKRRETQNENEAFKFLNLYIYIYLFIGILIAILILLFKNSYFENIFNIDIAIVNKNIVYIRIACLLPLLMLVTNLFSSIANAYNYFSVPIIISLVNSLIVLLVTLFFHKSLGAMCGIIALITGYTINIVLLLYILVVKIKWDFNQAYFNLAPHLRTTILVSYFTTLPITLRNYMVTYLFNGIGGGVLTAVNWGQQMAGLPDVFITNQIINITSIKFAEHHVKNEQIKAYELLYKIMEYLFIILFACMAISLLYSHEIIKILLSRGSFNQEKATITAVVFALLSILPVINAFPLVAGRLFIAFQLLKKTTLITTISHIVIIILLYFAIKKYSYVGLGAASVIGYGIQTLLYIYITKKTFIGIDLNKIFNKLLWPVILLSVLSLALFIFHGKIVTNWAKYLSFLFGCLLFSVTILLLYKKAIFAYFRNNTQQRP